MKGWGGPAGLPHGAKILKKSLLAASSGLSRPYFSRRTEGRGRRSVADVLHNIRHYAAGPEKSTYLCPKFGFAESLCPPSPNRNQIPPITEAFRAQSEGIRTPRYDLYQKSIDGTPMYKKIDEEVKAAINLLKASNDSQYKLGTNDFFYNGDVQKWIDRKSVV